MADNPPENSTAPESNARVIVSDPPAAFDSEHCSISSTLDALGDTWSILVLRELFFGMRRFNDIQNDLDISRSVLAARLARLVDLGVVRTEAYQEPGERVRHQYRLTRKGVDLLPVMVALMSWGDEHIFGGDGPITLHERNTGDRVRVELRTVNGDPVEPHQMVPRINR